MATYIAIPHQRHAEAWINPPAPIEEDGDTYAEGDHDLHAILTLEEARTWHGHQWTRVAAIVAELDEKPHE